MKRNLFALMLITVLSVIFSLPALAQTATVKGVCKDLQGNPIADAQVTWHNNDNGRNFTLKTNKKGEYFSLGIDPGKYTVTLSKDGKTLDSVTNFPASTEEITLDFDLKKSQEQGLTPEQAKQRQEQQQKIETYNKNITSVNEKLKAAAAAEQATPPNYDAAIQTLSEASQLAPDEDLVWFRLGQAYLDSVKTQTDAAEKTKRSTEAYNDLGKAINMLKSKTSAPQPAQGAEAAKPEAAAPGTKPEAAPAQGATAPPAQLNDKQKAMMAAYYDNFASAAARVGKPAEAIDAYTHAAEFDPSHAAKYYFNQGAVLTNSSTDQSGKKLAVQAFEKSISADPTRAEAYYWKGTNLIALASTDSAGKLSAPAGTAEAFQKYLELEPTGSHAEEAKQMLALLGTTVETSYGKKTPKKK